MILKPAFQSILSSAIVQNDTERYISSTAYLMTQEIAYLMTQENQF